MSSPSKRELKEFFQSEVFNNIQGDNYEAAIEEFYNRFGPGPLPLKEIVKNKGHIIALFEFMTSTPYGGHFVKDESIVMRSVVAGLFEKFEVVLNFDGNFKLVPAGVRINLAGPDAVKKMVRELGYEIDLEN